MRLIYLSGHVLDRQPEWQARAPFLAEMRKLIPQHYFFHDRSGYWPNELDIRTFQEIPARYEERREFADLLQTLTDGLLVRCLDEDKRLYVSYSGGIDSTCVTAAILASPHFPELKNRGLAHIGLTSKSIDENPEFFYDHLVHNFEFETINFDRLGDPRYVFTGGEHGDQLYTMIAIDKIQDGYSGPVHRAPWIVGLDRFLSGQKFPKWFVDSWYGFVETCPFKITNAVQLFWWFNFCSNWHELHLRDYRWSSAKLDWEGLNRAHYYPFGTAEFQNWSIGWMRDLEPPEDYRWIKKPSLDFIYTFDRNDTYYSNKGKYQSQTDLPRNIRKSVIWEDFSDSNDIHGGVL